MPSQVLAPGTAIADSSDIVVSGATPVTIALYLADDDNLILPDGFPYWMGNLLLPDGIGHLLLPTQATGEIVPYGDDLTLKLKDPLDAYNPTGVLMNQQHPVHVLSPGTWRISRDKITSVQIGAQKD